jgi:hypothetical protein
MFASTKLEDFFGKALTLIFFDLSLVIISLKVQSGEVPVILTGTSITISMSLNWKKLNVNCITLLGETGMSLKNCIKFFHPNQWQLKSAFGV